jgi:hypothetical protein
MKTYVALWLLVAAIELGGCDRHVGADGSGSDPTGQRAYVEAKVLALKSHLAEQERVEALRPERVAVPRMRPPPGLVAPPSPGAQPTGVATYREHIALLGEKQLLVDMQVALSSVSTDPNAERSKNRLTEMDAELGAIEGAQRQRDRALGIEPPRDHR